MLRHDEEEYDLYKCIKCGETRSANTPHIVCPNCGGKLVRRDIENYDDKDPSVD